MFSDDQPKGRRPHPEVPPAEMYLAAAKAVAARDEEPCLTASWVGKKKIRVQISSRPRAGTVQLFTKLLKKSDRPAITIEEVAASTAPDTAVSTYLFSHREDDREELTRYVDNLMADFEDQVLQLPVPRPGELVKLVLEIFPDRDDQLFDFLEANKQSDFPVNLHALLGRREIDPDTLDPDGLEFVLGPQTEDVGRYILGLPALVRKVQDARNQKMGADEPAEQWEIKECRLYTGDDLDSLAGAGDAPPPEKAPGRRNSSTSANK